MKVLKPFVLNGHDADPGHAGCVINGNSWEFRGSSDSKYDDSGNAVLDTVYASGTFQRSNPAYDPNNLPHFDVKTKLRNILSTVTGDEFYEIIPSSYGYKDHFRNYLKVVHAIPDTDCWAGKAYLTRLEIPEGTPDVYGSGYVIHPGILDSITQCGLAMSMNMDAKTFDFSGTFLPVSMKNFTRWDSKDALTMEDHFKNGIWVYYKPIMWGPKGPFISDYIVTDNDGRIIFTINNFEIALAPEPEPIPITDYSMQQRVVTAWQPKAFVTPNYILPLTGGHAGHSYIAEVLESLLINAKLHGHRNVSRVLDLDSTDSIARAVDPKLVHLLAKYQFAVDYFAAGVTAEQADSKVKALDYPHGRSSIVDLNTLSEEGMKIRFST
jgi:Polyketide synthase dehydratase